VALSALRAMEPRTGIDEFAPDPLVTRTGPREASRPVAEPVVRCRPGGAAPLGAVTLWPCHTSRRRAARSPIPSPMAASRAAGLWRQLV